MSANPNNPLDGPSANEPAPEPTLVQQNAFLRGAVKVWAETHQAEAGALLADVAKAIEEKKAASEILDMIFGVLGKAVGLAAK